MNSNPIDLSWTLGFLSGFALCFLLKVFLDNLFKSSDNKDYAKRDEK